VKEGVVCPATERCAHDEYFLIIYAKQIAA
jgi:hypothetical protein